MKILWHDGIGMSLYVKRLDHGRFIWPSPADGAVRAATAEARASEARAMLSGNEAVITTLKLEIEKLKRALYGQKSERRARLLDQLELQLEELEAAATEDELAAEKAAAQAKTAVRAFERRRPGRKPFPAHLPRERVVIEAPTACGCCGSERIVKMGEDGEPLSAIGPRKNGERDPGGDPAPVEGDPDRPGEVHLPALREDQPGPGALPPDAARLGRPEPARNDPVREVRPAPAAEPPGRAVCS